MADPSDSGMPAPPAKIRAALQRQGGAAPRQPFPGGMVVAVVPAQGGELNRAITCLEARPTRAPKPNMNATIGAITGSATGIIGAITMLVNGKVWVGLPVALMCVASVVVFNAVRKYLDDRKAYNDSLVAVDPHLVQTLAELRRLSAMQAAKEAEMADDLVTELAHDARLRVAQHEEIEEVAEVKAVDRKAVALLAPKKL